MKNSGSNRLVRAKKARLILDGVVGRPGTAFPAIESLQKIVGAVFFLPALKRSVDGTVLRELGDLVGHAQLTSILQFKYPLPAPANTDRQLVELSDIWSGGKSVLLASIQHRKIRQCVGARLRGECYPVSEELASALMPAAYEIAESLNIDVTPVGENHLPVSTPSSAL